MVTTTPIIGADSLKPINDHSPSTPPQSEDLACKTGIVEVVLILPVVHVLLLTLSLHERPLPHNQNTGHAEQE